MRISNIARICSAIAATLALVSWSLPATSQTADNQTADKEIEKRTDRRIVGGKETSIALHPYQVAIALKDDVDRGDNKVWCGGSIIAERWVLSAAHCFVTAGTTRRPDSQILVKIGATNIAKEGTWRPIERAEVHRCYNRTTGEDPYDLALVKLSDVAEKSREIPLAGIGTPLPTGDDVVVTGWGRTTEAGQLSETLQEVTVQLIDNETCNKDQSYGGKVTTGMLCAGRAEEGKRDSCNGDSGGPLVLGSGNNKTLVGVVSWGAGCARALKYGVYTRVGVYRDWISKVMQGTVPPCSAE